MRSFIVALALLASASAFSPTILRARSTVSMSAENVDRRDMLAKTAGVLGGVFAGAQAANADGAVSLATMSRSRGIYGTRVADLAGAVEKGDFEAVLAEKNAFVLFNNANNLPKLKEAKKVNAKKQEAIFAAAKAGDKAGLKAAYADYIKTAELPNPVYKGKDLAYSQGYSSDYDWRARTDRGTIYVR